jgi:hypothetical protein
MREGLARGEDEGRTRAGRLTAKDPMAVEDGQGKVFTVLGHEPEEGERIIEQHHFLGLAC